MLAVAINCELQVHYEIIVNVSHRRAIKAGRPFALSRGRLFSFCLETVESRPAGREQPIAFRASGRYRPRLITRLINVTRAI